MKNTIRRYGLALALLASTAMAIAPVQQASAKDKKVIGWSVAYFDHPVYQLMMKAAQSLADKSDCKVIFADGKNDASVQASQIDNFIAQGVDGIITDPDGLGSADPGGQKGESREYPVAHGGPADGHAWSESEVGRHGFVGYGQVGNHRRRADRQGHRGQG